MLTASFVSGRSVVKWSDDVIPFVDLKAQFDVLENEIHAGIDRVLHHGRFVLGPEVVELEQRLAQYVGVRHAVACSSGTDALLLALMAKNVGPGDAVFTTPFTFVATAEAIALLGAVPVFVDIDPVTFNLDPAQLESAVEAVIKGDKGLYPIPQQAWNGRLQVKGIIAVDLFGLPADYDRINAIASRYDLFVIEDSAQSFGAEYRGRKSGSLAEIAATSFFPAKPLGCYGDGGAVFTDEDELADVLMSLKMHGQGADRYSHIRIGMNARLDTLQAAILLAKLKVFDNELERRRQIAQQYNDSFRELGGDLRIPRISPHCKSAWAQYSLLFSKRDAVRDELKRSQVPSAIYYPTPLHMQRAFENLGYRQGDLPAAEQCSTEIFSIPMHPYLEQDHIMMIVSAVKNGVQRAQG